MKNSHAIWRIEFAQQISKRLVTFNGVRAIIIAGSVARGFADEFSDIEIPIFWETLPSDATRLAIVSALDGSFLYPYNGPNCEDQLIINDVQVDLWHSTVSDEDATIDGVLHEHHTDLGSLNALDTLRSCIALYGEEIVQKWKSRSQAYPATLAQKIIQEQLDAFHLGQLILLARRKNPTAFYAQLSDYQQGIFLILLALNRMYYPSNKWLYRMLEAMPVKPPAIGPRFRQAFEAPYLDAIEDTKKIIQETLALVRQQFPQMDLAPVDHRLSYVRTVHEKPVNL